MFRGTSIRAARKALGWTQRQLATRAGLSQPYISLIERSDEVPDAALAALRRVLPLEPTEMNPHLAPRVALSGPELPARGGGLPLRISTWHRPERGGDAMLAVPIGEFAVLLCAIDVVGQGESVYPLTTYLLGWLRGRVGALNTPPRLEVLAADLSREMSATGADASFFLGLFQRGSTEQEVRYESLVDRYPHPLLIVGEQLRTMPSAATVERGSVHMDFFPHVIGALRCPWRLVVSSDGLLSRLGGGSEAEGSRVLRRWQSGTQRDRPITEQLEEGDPPVDDESIMIVVWDGWDEEITLTAGDVPEEERVLRRLLEVATAHVGRPKGEALVQAALEALDNASTHAYDRPGGPVRVRWRVYEDRLSVEVVDVGRGISSSRARQECSGLSVMRRLCALCEVRRNEEGGTTVVLVMEKEGVQG